jgi:hypothetical protein
MTTEPEPELKWPEEPETRSLEDLVAEASALEEGDTSGVKRLINEAAALGLDDLDVDELINAIKASTGKAKGALTGLWKQAKKRAEGQAVQEAIQRAKEEAQAKEDLAKAEAEALWEQMVERIAPLARDPNILGRGVAVVHRIGAVREDIAIEATFVTTISRFLRKVISLLRRGTAASGKNYIFELVLRLVPLEDIIQISASSAKVLPYTDPDNPDAFKHKLLYFPEAAGVLARKAGGQEHEMASMARTFISENRLVYPSVMTRPNGQTPIAIYIIKEGPIAVLVTSARNDIEDELMTRFALADSDESERQSQLIVEDALKRSGGLGVLTAVDQAEIDLFCDFQRWLARGAPYDVVLPFYSQVHAAYGLTPRAVRIRRDINTLIAAVKAVALLHKAQRNVDAAGRIVATFADYEIAWRAFNPGVANFHNPKFSPGVIALVRALEGLVAEARARVPAFMEFDGATSATWAQLTQALGLASKDTISTRLEAAKTAGAIECVNDTAPRNIPRRYRVLVSAEHLAKTGAFPVFPDPKEVRRMMENSQAHERAKAAFIEEETRAGGEGAGAKAKAGFEDPDDVPF